MFTLLLCTTFVCMMLVGMLAALWERMPWVMSERLKIPEAVCRGWESWLSFPLVVTFPVVGYWIDSWKGQDILFIGILILAASLAWLGQHRTVGSALAAVLLFCVAAPCIALPTLAILPRTFTDYKSVLVLNVLFGGVVLGMLLTPRLVKLVVQRFEVRHGLLILALLCLIPALCVSLIPADYFPQPANSVSMVRTVQQGRSWILAALIFLYYPMFELLRHLKNGTGYDSPWDRLGFWTAMLVIPPFAGQFIWAGYETWGLAVLALIHAIVLGNLAASDFSRRSPLGLWAAAGTFAPFLPTLLAVYSTSFPKNPAGAMGLALGCGALCNFLFQPMLARFNQRASATAGVWLSMLFSLGWGALALVLAIVLGPRMAH